MTDTSEKSGTGYNLSNVEQDFRTYLSAGKKLSPLTVKNYISDLRFFDGWLKTYGDNAHPLSTVHTSRETFLQSITADHIEDYKNYLSEGGFPRRTINRRLSTMRAFFTFAIKQGWTTSNPAKSVHNVRKPGAQPRKNQHSEPKHGVLGSLIVSFGSDMRNDPAHAEHTDTYMKDIEEFFSIINSQSGYEDARAYVQPS